MRVLQPFSNKTGQSRPLQACMVGWGVVGLAAVLALVALQAPAWVHSMALVLWCLVWGGFVMSAPGLRRSGEPPQGERVDAAPPPTPADSPAPGQDHGVPTTESRVADPVPGQLSHSPADDAQAGGPPDTATPISMTQEDQEVLRYALSHDLRAPLRVVEGFTKIVKEDYARVLDRLGQDHLDRVLAASARMNSMIDAILAQAQLAGTRVERQQIDLTAMAREVAHELCNSYGEGPAVGPDGVCRARFEVADGLRAEGDPTLVRRIVENLLGNALKYSAKVEQPCVQMGVMPATNPSVFYVRDNGAGFDMQHADKLFGLFQRLHSAKDFPGTGVGLAGVKNIVARHGGRVWAEAQLGHGACFYFTLISAAEAQQRAGAAGTGRNSSRSVQGPQS